MAQSAVAINLPIAADIPNTVSSRIAYKMHTPP